MSWIAFGFGFFFGSLITYMVKEVYDATKSTWLVERIRECAVDIAKADTLGVLDTVPKSELVRAVLDGGIDALIQKRREQLSKLHPELRSRKTDIEGSGKAAD